MDNLVGYIPPVTKGMLVISFGLMAACTLEFISPFSLYFNWEMVWEHGQWWRLFTCFLFYGDLGLGFMWNVYVMYFYCSQLEEVVFRQRSGDFVYMLLVSMFMLLGISFLTGHFSNFYSGAIIDVMTYVWARRNPGARVHVIAFTVQAPYLPWILAGISLIMGGQLADHLQGILAGHIYYFFTDVYPKMPTSNGLQLLRTPKLLKWRLKCLLIVIQFISMGKRRSEPLKTVFTETVDEGGWEVDDTLMDENVPLKANTPLSLVIREHPEAPQTSTWPSVIPLPPPSPPEGYILGELSDDEYMLGELSP
ncbi:hypothetical protein FOL47_006652 [Perkinsus chesapeaki]|uniref:Derlin n=1 Tax=Perkinsus chesapeaki TaxID=330153 RepID=A0A7J6LQI6_PERCH|nr:hypothetical protein FOL47_006652 [Perkinsus chesapeaki]